MTNYAEVWSRKSDEQVQDAVGHLTEYSAEAQAAILGEASQRGLDFEQTLTADDTLTATPPSASLVECYVQGWRRGLVFRGRAGRKECFTFLFANTGMLVAGLLAVSTVWWNELFAWLLVLFFLAIQVPHRAVIVRRLHDIGRVGWWVLFGLVPILGGVALLGLLLQDGERGPNRWGEPA